MLDGALGDVIRQTVPVLGRSTLLETTRIDGVMLLRVGANKVVVNGLRGETIPFGTTAVG